MSQAYVQVMIKLGTEKDADILAWLEGQNKSAAIRDALRKAMEESDGDK